MVRVLVSRKSMNVGVGLVLPENIKTTYLSVIHSLHSTPRRLLHFNRYLSVAVPSSINLRRTLPLSVQGLDPYFIGAVLRTDSKAFRWLATHQFRWNGFKSPYLQCRTWLFNGSLKGLILNPRQKVEAKFPALYLFSSSPCKEASRRLSHASVEIQRETQPSPSCDTVEVGQWAIGKVAGAR